MPATEKRVGFLATGTELTTGEIVNTNSQLMATQLHDANIVIGEHLLCDDDTIHIISALEFLMAHHNALIVTGGLGPTSDDRTRFAVADFVKKPLLFAQESFERLSARIISRGRIVTDNNRQQALFPETATILPNLNGTADGSLLTHHGKCLFLLPGPPHENLPMFEAHVLPHLLQTGFAAERFFQRWRISQVGESTIASILEEHIEVPYGIQLGYRAYMPYIDIKLSLAKNHPNLEAIVTEINTILNPYLA